MHPCDSATSIKRRKRWQLAEDIYQGREQANKYSTSKKNNYSMEMSKAVVELIILEVVFQTFRSYISATPRRVDEIHSFINFLLHLQLHSFIIANMETIDDILFTTPSPEPDQRPGPRGVT